MPKLIITIDDQTHDVPDCPGKHVHSHQVSAEVDYTGDNDRDKSCNGSIAHAISHIVAAVELVLDHLYGKPIARGDGKEAAFAAAKATAEREAGAAEDPDEFPTDPDLFESELIN